MRSPLCRVPDHISRKALTLEGKSRHWAHLPPETGLAESRAHWPDSTAGASRSACVSDAAVVMSPLLLWIEILAATSTLQIALTATS
jgi:hypothetical protein